MSFSGRSWCRGVYHCLHARGHSCHNLVRCTSHLTAPRELRWCFHVFSYWPSKLPADGCQVLSFPISWVSQDILAHREKSEVIKPLQITFIPSLLCTSCSKWKQTERQTRGLKQQSYNSSSTRGSCWFFFIQGKKTTSQERQCGVRCNGPKVQTL